jgi:hypothetical protein
MILAEPRYWLLVGLTVLALLGLVAVVRGTRTPAHKTVRVHGGVGGLGMAGRAMVTAGLIVAVQWLAITLVDRRSLVFWLALAVPTVLAGVTAVRALTITVITGRGGGR